MAGANGQVSDENTESEVVIVDDTPPEDRGKQPLPQNMVEDLEKDNLEEYSTKVRQRLSQLKKVFHDERRAKEAAAREKEEAYIFARRQYDENQALKRRLGAGEKIFIDEGTKSANSELASARERLKQAVENGDAEKITAAQEALTDAKLKLDQYARFQPSLQQDTEGVQPLPQARAPAPAREDPKLKTWLGKNSWYGADEEMTSLALGVHQRLVKSGVDPDSDDYYEQIDKTMRKRFPDYFREEVSETPEQRQESKPERKNTTVVASASRSTAPRQIRLTASQAALAKRLGITPEAYAREQLKLEQSNG